MGKRFWFSFTILGLLIVAVLYLRQSNSQPAVEIRSSIRKVVEKAEIIPSPTPYPHRDLTIPYLRQQNYQSTLGDLQEVSRNTYYTSYLTNYTSDGLKINGLLAVPAGIAPDNGWPAIVFVHGYIPPKLYTTLGQYTDYVDYLARSGFVVFKIDLRGNGDSQGQPAGYYSAGYVRDTLNAYAALQTVDASSSSAFKINPGKIGLWAHSMAGNIVMRAWATKPDIPAVVIWSGAGYSYTDLQKYKLHDPSFQRMQDATDSANFHLQKLYGRPDLSKPFWHDMAPVSFLSDLKGALQIDQAQDDNVVNIGYNRDLMKLFDATSVPHEMHVYPTGGHNISGPSFTQAMENTVAFYKKYLE